jgi:hypothetical protein
MYALAKIDVLIDGLVVPRAVASEIFRTYAFDLR